MDAKAAADLVVIERLAGRRWWSAVVFGPELNPIATAQRPTAEGAMAAAFTAAERA